MIAVYDLETLLDFFLYIDLDIKTGEFNVFEISSLKNDYEQLIVHLKEVICQIGFNSLGFDSQIQEKLIREYRTLKNLNGETLAGKLHEYSQEVINKSNENKWPDYNERDLKIKQIDLYKIWHFDNEARRTSLKWIQYMTDWHNIEDMPINHLDRVTDRETADKIISYCKNDCLSTLQFYKISRGDTDISLYRGIDKLQLRKDVKAEFGFVCTNFNDVKIGDEINRVNYLKSTGLDRYDLKEMRVKTKTFTFKDCFPSYASFITPELKKFIGDISNEEVDLMRKQEFAFKFGSTKYTLAKGGLHSDDPARVIIPTSNEILRDADVGSMYPNAIRKRRLYPQHLGEKWLDGYADIIEHRLDAKEKFKETKDPKYQSIESAFKLALNGGSFGKTNEKSNWQYDPFVTFCTTIGCQIDLLMLIERFELAGIKVVSANTDGVLCLFDKQREQLYKDVCEEWEKEVGNYELGRLDFVNYQLFAQRSVNDYIAVKTNGEAKQKGASFTLKHEIHRNKSYRVIPLALNEYFTKGIAPSFFITNHNNIFDFCAGKRMKGAWYAETRGFKDGILVSERLQKTNRYYISNHGMKLIKCNPDGREIQEDAGKWLCTIYNKHVQKPIEDYDINYSFYIRKVNEIISEIQPELPGGDHKQLSLF